MKIIIKVKPNSRAEKIEKTANGYLVYVKEPPIENKANQAVIKLLADYFKIPKSQISILSGLKSKQKIVELKDLNP
ncbi:MAG: DUF167 domain-containing protein [candidate division WOR-3 bacterium]|nr:DUF167 domain-containing protein [candidate division WOR-3 bacterium]